MGAAGRRRARRPRGRHEAPRGVLAPAEVALLDEADFAAHPFLVKGYIGPGALAANGVRFLVDPRMVTGTAWVTGADKADHHVVDLVAGRDFTPDGTIEAAEVRAGDPSPGRHGVLEAARGIEIGHIFQLGRKYAEAFALAALDPDGKPVRMTMGPTASVSPELVAAMAEQTHDENGLCWPRSVAPFDVHLVAAGKHAEYGAARGAGRRARRRGLRVLLDDREGFAGVKFADAELVGVPTIVVVGRGLASGVIEVKDREDGGTNRGRARVRGRTPTHVLWSNAAAERGGVAPQLKWRGAHGTARRRLITASGPGTANLRLQDRPR